MLLVITGALSAALWVLLWGIGLKAFDALMISLLIMVIAGAAYMILQFLPGHRSRREPDPDPAPFT